MAEYLHVEKKPFLTQLETLGWKVIDQGTGIIPSDPSFSLGSSSGEWIFARCVPHCGERHQ